MNKYTVGLKYYSNYHVYLGLNITCMYRGRGFICRRVLRQWLHGVHGVRTRRRFARTSSATFLVIPFLRGIFAFLRILIRCIRIRGVQFDSLEYRIHLFLINEVTKQTQKKKKRHAKIKYNTS